MGHKTASERKLAWAFCLVISGLAAIGPLSLVLGGQTPENPIISLRLGDEARSDRAEPAFPGLEVRLETAKSQKASDGVAITIVLSNRGRRPVSLFNVEDGFTLQLNDAAGRSVDVPSPPARVLGHFARIAGRPNPYRQDTTIEPGGEYRFVAKTSAALAKVPAGQPPRRVPIPPGQYSAKIALHLMGTRQLANGRVEDRGFWSEPFEIRLTAE
jgi:hypothetical protein